VRRTSIAKLTRRTMGRPGAASKFTSTYSHNEFGRLDVVTSAPLVALAAIAIGCVAASCFQTS